MLSTSHTAPRTFACVLLAALGAIWLLQGDGLGAAQPEVKSAANSKTRAQAQIDLARLTKQAEQSQSSGNHSAAIAAGEKALAIARELHGESSEAVASWQYRLAIEYETLRDWSKAEDLLQKSLAIRRKVLGPSHPLCAQTEEHLGGLFYQRGNYARAEPLFREALDVRKKAGGDQSAEYATALECLGNAILYEGDYSRAEPLLQNALKIRRAQSGAHHPVCAASLNDLGFLYYRQGELSKACLLFEEAIEINRSIAGPPSAILGTNYDNLAKTCLGLGDVPRAKRLFRDALDVHEKTVGVESSPYAISLGNLGTLYQSVADDSRAEPLIKRALEIETRVLGKDHPQLAFHLDQLADTYVGRGDLGRALPLYLRSLALRKKKLGDRHPFYATSLDNVAGIDALVGNAKNAEKLYRSALGIRKAVFGEERPEYAQSLNNLGLLELARGATAQAEPHLRQALAIRKKTLGARHAATAAGLNNLGLFDLAVGKSAEGEPLCREALEISLAALDQALGGLAERQQLTFEAGQQAYLNNYLSMTIPAHVSDETVYGYVLKAKGSVTARQWLLRARQQKPELKPLCEELASVNTRLANLALAQPDPSHPENRLRELDALTQRKESLEEKLAARSSDFANARGAARLSAAQEVPLLQSVLPQRTVLVDVLEYWHCEPRTIQNGTLTFERRLVAFVARRKGDVKRVELGPTRKVTGAVENWRRVAVVPDRPRTNGLEFLRELKALVWDKLEPCLDGADTVVLSPDGPLCKFPWGALPGRQPDSYLIEDRTIVVWPIPRLLPQLASRSPEEPKSREPQSLLLVGDVDYGGKPGRGDEVAARSAPRLESLRNFGKLDHSAAEVAAIQLSFSRQFKSAPVDLLLGDEATESAFRRQAPTHRWLHLATHGFYDPPELHARRSATSLSPEGARLANMAGDQTLFGNGGPGGYHPGLLSGLALAGANSQTVIPGDDDGILTALEVSSLDLGGVDLAVLSACETGLGATAGDTPGGEGLLGLQRAFQVAGARSVMAGLWRVPDRETMLLMQRFYQNLWTKKLSKAQALREAQIWMLKETKPRGLDVEDDETKNTSKRLLPKYWAGFVLSGDWR
jgi:CHAT domain-containing protein/Tfp pilus assembly protein PilF